MSALLAVFIGAALLLLLLVVGLISLAAWKGFPPDQGDFEDTEGSAL